MLQCEKISMMFPSKLSKCLHVHVLSFHRVHGVFLVSEHKNVEQDWHDESYDSLFPIVFSKFERESHTYLAFAVVPRKVLFQLVLQWKECIAQDEEGDDVDPMHPFQKLQIWYSFHHQVSVSIDNQQKPYKWQDEDKILVPQLNLEMPRALFWYNQKHVCHSYWICDR